MSFGVAFVTSFLLALAATPLVRRFAIAIGAMDHPNSRKVHLKPVARLGGLAIFFAFVLVVLAMLPVGRQLGALLGGVFVLVVLGAVDDIRGLKPLTKLLWQIVAACVVLAGGIGITTITNPFGGIIDLSWGRFAVDLLGFDFHITPIANLLSVIWMVGLVNAINFLDGLDGLACGVSGIAALVMFALAIQVGQPVVALLAIILAGSALGFLPYNFFPARIFMGDSGAYFLGLTLALLAIYSGGKLATAALVLGFVIVDALWAAVRRIRRGTHPFKADREHLHHLMLAAGLSQRTAVLLLYSLAIFFGIIALASTSFSKFLALVALFCFMVVLLTALVKINARRGEG
ncbi:MAG TPA: MraY family glycosyltransferase [Candidatus Dormibacteraeota bacterium]|nr:MraY family glycosyltransferase [Candidatus Dormibacteraeota bacterium]